MKAVSGYAITVQYILTVAIMINGIFQFQNESII